MDGAEAPAPSFTGIDANLTENHGISMPISARQVRIDVRSP